jgi:hypothetical protein
MVVAIAVFGNSIAVDNYVSWVSNDMCLIKDMEPLRAQGSHVGQHL